MRDYLLVTRAVDPVALERFRMEHMGAGYVSARSKDMLC
jgi:acyl-[acyl-carrier-protein] desaturase